MGEYSEMRGSEWWPVKNYHVRMYSAHYTQHLEFHDLADASGYAYHTLGCWNNMRTPDGSSEMYASFTITDRVTGKIVMQDGVDTDRDISYQLIQAGVLSANWDRVLRDVEEMRK